MTQNSHNLSAFCWLVVNLLALLLALVGIVALVYLLTAKLAGGEAWTGWNWVAMGCLPLAFVFLALSILHAARRRRQL